MKGRYNNLDTFASVQGEGYWSFSYLSGREKGGGSKRQSFLRFVKTNETRKERGAGKTQLNMSLDIKKDEECD